MLSRHRTAFLTVILLCSSLSTTAQLRVLGEVKKSISDLNVTVDGYKNAMKKIVPALSHDETKDLAETWYLAAKIGFGQYDKSISSRAIGRNIDNKEMGHALLDAYDYSVTAMALDTVWESNRDGSPKIDKKTGKQKYKIKYSKEIDSRVYLHLIDFNAVGAELYNIKDWDGAYRAWDIYCNLSTNENAAARGMLEADTVVGRIRFYQGLAAYQKEDFNTAHKKYEEAISKGYDKKEVYDNALYTLARLNDTTGVVRLAEDAYRLYADRDPQYVKILINNYLNNYEFEQAGTLLDEVIARDSTNAEYQDIKGNLVEQLEGLENAMPYYKKAVALDPNYIQGNFDLGRGIYNQATQVKRQTSRRAKDQYREAETYLEKVLQQRPDDEDTRRILRDIYYQLNEGKKLEELERQR